MPSIRLSEVVPHSCQEMYDLVVDVERYPEFLPWCVKGRTFGRTQTQFIAEMTISFKGFRDSFQTVDRIVPGSRVEINLLQGPFKYLASVWQFTPIDGGTRIDFFIDFKFQNRLLEMMIGAVFTQAAKQMVSAFRRRADQVYVKGGRKEVQVPPPELIDPDEESWDEDNGGSG